LARLSDPDGRRYLAGRPDLVWLAGGAPPALGRGAGTTAGIAHPARRRCPLDMAGDSQNPASRRRSPSVRPRRHCSRSGRRTGPGRQGQAGAGRRGRRAQSDGFFVLGRRARLTRSWPNACGPMAIDRQPLLSTYIRHGSDAVYGMTWPAASKRLCWRRSPAKVFRPPTARDGGETD